jgi:flavin reductase (DIM6/NTAB) family NADH-FMN oxidoreductase RutF
MILDLSTLTPSQVYANLVQTIIPRPIAWVLSENKEQNLNLAPYSYFNAVCSAPPLLMISVGRKPDGTPKDTKVNIEERGHFVIHLVDETTLDDMNTSSLTLDYGDSEVSRLGLKTVDFEGFSLPRLEKANIAFACTRYQILQLGDSPQSVIFGLIHQVYINDAVIGEDAKGRMKVLADKVKPIGRMGAGEYVSFGTTIRKPRPE